MSALCAHLLVGIVLLCGCGPSDAELLQQAVTSISADRALEAEIWEFGGTSRQLSADEVSALVAGLSRATLKVGRDQNWGGPTPVRIAIIHTSGGGRVSLCALNETDVMMWWSSLRLPSGEVSDCGEGLVLLAPELAAWLGVGV